ncbi:uncharacterized protein G2W53_019679 [Senna tora]|uniref:Uncharacterized protein n=1 Tax=Senna tora TaxID=362788 RepID=A0A834WM72_9FABA|nr:uncharacterized protein G2W53_019679 [Senna tora]
MSLGLVAAGPGVSEVNSGRKRNRKRRSGSLLNF